MKIITEWTLDDLVALAHQELTRQGFQPEEGEGAVISFEDRQIANANLVVKLAVVKAQPAATASTTQAAPDETIAPPKVKNEGKRQAMTPERLSKMQAARAAKRKEREAAQTVADNGITTNGHDEVEVELVDEMVEVVAAPVSPF